YRLREPHVGRVVVRDDALHALDGDVRLERRQFFFGRVPTVVERFTRLVLEAALGVDARAAALARIGMLAGGGFQGHGWWLYLFTVYATSELRGDELRSDELRGDELRSDDLFSSPHCSSPQGSSLRRSSPPLLRPRFIEKALRSGREQARHVV